MIHEAMTSEVPSQRIDGHRWLRDDLYRIARRRSDDTLVNAPQLNASPRETFINKSFSSVLYVFLVLSLSGCLVNRTRSTIDDSQTAYSMTRDQARDIVKSSIAAFISPDYVNQTAADSLTASGYIRAGIDTQTINVTAIPATGRDADSRSRSGYGFLLNDRGTIGYDPTPDEIWKYVLKRANQVGKPFRVASGR